MLPPAVVGHRKKSEGDGHTRVCRSPRAMIALLPQGQCKPQRLAASTALAAVSADAMAQSLSQKSRSSIIDSQGPLSQTEKSRSALAAATAEFATQPTLRRQDVGRVR